MDKLISVFITLVIQFGFLVSLVVAQQIPISQLIGKYSSGHEFFFSTIELSADENYTIESSGCTEKYISSGKFTVLENALSFDPLYRKIDRGGISDEQLKGLSPEQKKMVADEEEYFAEGAKTYKMIPVRWDGRLYLISEDEMKNFYNAVNLGLEPRLLVTSSPHFYGSFYLREGDEFKDVTGKPELPQEWQSFILDAPVTATVIGMDDKKTAVINKGTADGLKVGMRLIKKGAEPSFWSDAEIISVEKDTARLSVKSEVKIGTTLTSTFFKSKEYIERQLLMREIWKQARQSR